MITVQLAREKETKRTIRFAEQADDPRVGMIYVPKATVKELGDPERITVTLDAA